MNKKVSLSTTTLIRDIYRTLINSGRSYAAFSESDKLIFSNLETKKYILDPMSGYGLLTKYCAEKGIKSYSLEFNAPAYYWQILCHPQNTQLYISCIEQLLEKQSLWPITERRAIISDDLFPQLSLDILVSLLTQNKEIIKQNLDSKDKNIEELALSLLLPFSGRLSCITKGEISTHVKRGGIVVLRGWHDDYNLYLQALRNHLINRSNKSRSLDHVVKHGDARTFDFPKGKFDGLFTSPPYPNHQDFVTMFSPEQELLKTLGINSNIALRKTPNDIIGSNFVSGKPNLSPHSVTASNFIKAINSLKRSKASKYDDEKYYIPYFQQYFVDLEKAYQNISTSFIKGFEGYIIVVNNTHRSLVVPISDFIIEVWREMGFNAEVDEANELFHIGTKNPRARGIRARHTKYVIKVWGRK